MKLADGTYTTQHERIVALLWSEPRWFPTFELQSRATKFGYIGSSGEQRVRELARNASCVPEILRGKVEKRRNGKYEEFRFIPKAEQHRLMAAEMCRRFGAGLPANEVLA